MNCIATHHKALHAPLLSMQSNMASKNKILSNKALNTLLPDLLRNTKHATPSNAQKLSRSIADLGLMTRDAQSFTSCADSVRSMSKLHQLAQNSASTNRLTQNAVFTAHTTRGAPNGTSMSKLHQLAQKSLNQARMNRLTHNAVFTAARTRGAPTAAPPAPSRGVPSAAPAQTRQLSQALKVCKDIANRQRINELKLDDMGNLSRRMEEYRKLKKSGKYNYDFSTDSDDEDLE
ncbi:unnamed protein product [Cylindrotheca closterium]|uniref:Uncharacterized protein n=1 Tax=Cylindrotheca closterium TaxID=2856 RepID=A0AAD2FTD5_9STRA|nr:unnamed protein product [Cylindrotheca closterium]